MLSFSIQFKEVKVKFILLTSLTLRQLIFSKSLFKVTDNIFSIAVCVHIDFNFTHDFKQFVKVRSFR